LETTSANGVSYTEGVDNLDITFSFATAGTSASISLDLSGLTYQSKDPLNVNLTTVTGDAETRQTAIGFTHLLNAESSKRALDTVKNRIQDLSALEGEYGAIEARLLVAGNQLSVNRENFTTASSQITDADIATESANLLKNQILQQAATSVLGQANQQPAMALRFLNEI
jgi:flagellin